MSGGPHTNFDTTSFPVGAVGGAFSIAGALAAGIANFRAASEAKYDGWSAAKLIAVIRYCELMRAKEQIAFANAMKAANARIAELERGIISAARRQPR